MTIQAFRVAAAVVALLSSPAADAAVLTARDQGNGEVLLEWSAEPDAVSYRVERTAGGVPAVSLEAGSGLNAMDVAGITPSYQYRLMVRAADGTERMAGGIVYQAPAGVNARAAQAAGRPPQLRAALGTNLNAITYYSPQMPFVDVMKSASAWVSGDAVNWDNRQPLDLDANGWVRSLAPGQVARTLMLLTEGYPAGQYVVRYRGQGTLHFTQAAAVVPGSERPGELRIQVTAGKGGIHLDISATNPADYLRDIQVIMPGGVCEGDPFIHVAGAPACAGRFLPFAEYARSIVFYPPFVERLRAYSVLRFMDWMRANGNAGMPNPVARWSQRTSVSYRTWAADTGAPIEVMMALANRTGAHPWFSLPHGADDVYTHNLALTVKARLDPALGVYTEHSNEVWNPVFPQYAYAVARGAAQVPPIDNMQYHALRSRTIGSVFESVLGAPRAVTVLAAQATNPWTATRGLEYLEQRFGSSARGIDAVAIAPYFGITPDAATAGQYAAMTLDALFAHVGSTVLPRAARAMADYRSIALADGLKLISYEGGQHMVGVGGAENNTTLTALFHAFNRDPRIKALYAKYLGDWRASGGELFVHFTDIGRYDKWGAWGALESLAQPRTAAPKFDALQTFIEHNPVWWAQ